jgi:hypothetical protein
MATKRIGPVLEMQAYQVARDVYEQRLLPKEGIERLANAGINRNSARDFIYILRSMLGGEAYKRAMSTGATRYFLNRILHDYGVKRLKDATAALRLHVAYKGDAMPGYLAIASDFEAVLGARSRDRKRRPTAQILPMAMGESDHQSIVEVQEGYFLNQLPHQLDGSYHCYTTISAAGGSTVLFQYQGMIIATARLIRCGALPPKKDVNGYTHELVFEPSSIRVFEPIEPKTIKMVWPKVSQLSQVRWKLDPKRLAAFEVFVRNARTPEIKDKDAMPDEVASIWGYVPSGEDTRTHALAQIRLRRGQQTFRKDLLKRFGALCVVTGSGIVALLEAAHIVPYRGHDDNHVENGLILRSDIHTLFDLNLLGIEPETLKIELHPSVATEYADIENTQLRCSPSNRPSRAALQERYAAFLKKLQE